MKVGITGSNGMLGWHFRCYLTQFEDVEVVLADRSTFSDSAALQDFVSGTDAIAHFAGQNRGDDAEIAKVNVDLAKALVSACRGANQTPHIVYSSTIHIDKDNAYGISKKEAGQQFQDWAEQTGAKYSEMVLPHVFGEKTKPFYNSVVATFAYQIAVGETPEVINDGNLELVHAQQVSERALEIMQNGIVGSHQMDGAKHTVIDILERLQAIAAAYQGLVIPDVREPMTLRLFNLYRSYLFPHFYPKELTLHSDERGDLVEIVKERCGGQAFISTTKPGITRGNHFHFHKIERFLVLQGRARIEVRRLFDDKTHVFDVSGEKPAFVDMPPLHTHNITNTGEDSLLTIFWSHEIFDPDHPDTVFANV